MIVLHENKSYFVQEENSNELSYGKVNMPKLKLEMLSKYSNFKFSISKDVIVLIDKYMDLRQVRKIKYLLSW